MSVAIICDKCHKNVATQVIVQHNLKLTDGYETSFWVGDRKISYLCDQCAGVEPLKSVTYSSETERKKDDD